MSGKDIAIKVAVGTVTALFAGIGSILGSEGAKAAINAVTNKEPADPNALPDPTTVSTQPMGAIPVPPVTNTTVEVQTTAEDTGA